MEENKTISVEVIYFGKSAIEKIHLPFFSKNNISEEGDSLILIDERGKLTIDKNTGTYTVIKNRFTLNGYNLANQLTREKMQEELKKIVTKGWTVDDILPSTSMG